MNRSPYELINSNDDSLWQKGLEELMAEHTANSCKAIITVLSNISWHKREIAAKALIKWGDGLSDILEPNVSEQNIDQYYWLLYILGHIADQKSINILKKGLNNSDSELRSYAVRGLGYKKSIENARALYPMLNDNNWSIRKLAFEQLLSFDSLILDDLRRIIKNPSNIPNHSIIALFVKIGKDSILAELSEIYKKGNFSIRFSILNALGELGTSRSIDYLISGLADPSWAIRKLAAENLSKLGPKAFDQLSASFGRVDSLIRYEIIKIIVNLLGDRSLPLLKKLLSSSDQEIKLLAIDNLARLKSDFATQEIILCLADSDRIVSDYAADCLSHKPNLNLDLILRILNVADENLRFQAIKIIGSIGGLALIPIIKILESGKKQERLFLLGVLQKIAPDKKVIDVLIKLLGDENWPVRNAAANCLINYGQASVTSIARVLDNPSEDIRFWSRKSLVAIGPEAVKVLIKLLEDGTEPGIIPHIVSALLQMNNPEAVPAVIKFIETSDDFKIQNVFDSLPEVTSKDVINTVLNLLTHPNERVSLWLSEILKKVKNPDLHRNVLLGFSHSNESVRYLVAQAVSSWDFLSENDIKSIVRQLQVETSQKNIEPLLLCLAKNSNSSVINALEEFLTNYNSSSFIDLLLKVSSFGSDEYLKMLKSILNKRLDLIKEDDSEKVGKLFSNLYKGDMEGLVSGLKSSNKALRKCSVLALDAFNDRKIAFDIMENIIDDEEDDVLKCIVKVLAKYFFYDDFRLKAALTDFYLNLGNLITEPLVEYIRTLENELDKKALVDLIESVGGTVPSDALLSKNKHKIMLSDNHLDEVLEKRRMALEELEKYDELIKESHTKELSIMFTDVKGFTAFSSKASLSEVMSMLKQHDEILQPVFEKYGGEALKKIGDAFLVVFEDHNKALLAAMEIQRKLVEYNNTAPDERKLAVRITINTGSVIRTENDVMGDPVNLASRLEGITDAFEVVISEFTYNKIDKTLFELKSNGAHEFKGIGRPIDTYKVIWS